MGDLWKSILLLIPVLFVPEFVFASADPPVLNSVSFDSASLDVSSTDQVLVISVEFAEEVEVTNSQIILENSNVGVTKKVSSCPYENVTLSCEITFSSDDPSGEWSIKWVIIYTPDVSKYYSIDDGISGMESIMQLAGGYTDFEAPVLVEILLDKESLDVSQSTRFLTIDIKATDESHGIGTPGFKKAYIQLGYIGEQDPENPNSGTPVGKNFFWDTSRDRADPSTGIYNATSNHDSTYSHPSNSQPFNVGDDVGFYRVKELTLEDRFGNSRSYEDYNLTNEGLNKSVRLNGGNTDFEAPVLKAFSLDKATVILGEDVQFITANLVARDETDGEGTPGFYIARAQLRPLNYPASIYSCDEKIRCLQWAASSSVDGLETAATNIDPETGIYDTETAIDSQKIARKSNAAAFTTETTPGLWEIAYLSLTDSLDHGSAFSGHGLMAAGVKPYFSVLGESTATAKISLTMEEPSKLIFEPNLPDTPSSKSYATYPYNRSLGDSTYLWFTGSENNFYAKHSFSVTNDGETEADNLVLRIFTNGVYRSGFSDSSGNVICSIAGGYNFLYPGNPEAMSPTITTCDLPKLGARETQDFELTLGTTDSAEIASLNLSVYSLQPEVNMDDNAGFYSFSVNRDEDRDGVGSLQDAFPNDSSETKDSDSDGVGDNTDAFPNDASETLDTDSDGTGNNADTDDDGDGFTDEQEAIDGTNSLSRFSCRSGCFSFDVDQSSSLNALTDGLLVMRHLFDFSGDTLVANATDTSATRSSASDISSYLTDAQTELDIDGNGEVGALTDGLMLIRYLFDFRGESLISNAVDANATRKTAAEIEAYIEARVPGT